MARGKGPQLQRLADDQARQETFNKRKQSLLKKAMELSVLCDCEVGLVVVGSGERVSQYCSSGDLEQLVKRCATASPDTQECFTTEELLTQHYPAREEGPGVSGQDRWQPPAKRGRSAEPPNAFMPMPLATTPGQGGVMGILGPSGQPVLVEGVKAAGFLDKRNYPVSPRSEKAYDDITQEFERLTSLRSKGPQQAPDHHPGYAPLQPMLSALPSHMLAGSAMGGSGAGPSSSTGEDGGGPGGGKRFKALSIVVPENQAQPIVTRTQQNGGTTGTAAGETAAGSAGASGSVGGGPGGAGAGPSGAGAGGGLAGHLKDSREDYIRRVSFNGLTTSYNSEGIASLLNLASPSANFFGPLSSDGLLSGRALALGLDLNTPDSKGMGMGAINDLDWTAASPRQQEAEAAQQLGEPSQPQPEGTPDAPSGSESNTPAGEGGGTGNTAFKDLIITGMSLSKLPPEALEAAIGPAGDSLADNMLTSPPGEAGGERAGGSAAQQEGGDGAIDIPLDL